MSRTVFIISGKTKNIFFVQGICFLLGIAIPFDLLKEASPQEPTVSSGYATLIKDLRQRTIIIYLNVKC